jgi:hypothetical protein
LNVFRHRASGRLVATNYKVMHSFFRTSKFFVNEHLGESLRSLPSAIEVDFFIFRRPVDRFFSFYKDKVVGGNIRSLHSDLTRYIDDEFGVDCRAGSCSSIPPDKFAERLPFILLLDPHLYPQTYCLNWIRPHSAIRMESDLGVLSEAFLDVDFSKKVNETADYQFFGDSCVESVVSAYSHDVKFYENIIDRA